MSRENQGGRNLWERNRAALPTALILGVIFYALSGEEGVVLDNPLYEVILATGATYGVLKALKPFLVGFTDGLRGDDYDDRIRHREG